MHIHFSKSREVNKGILGWGGHSCVVPLCIILDVNVSSEGQWGGSCVWLFPKEDLILNMTVSPQCGCSLSLGKAGGGFAASTGLDWWWITQHAAQCWPVMLGVVDSGRLTHILVVNQAVMIGAGVRTSADDGSWVYVLLLHPACGRMLVSTYMRLVP